MSSWSWEKKSLVVAAMMAVSAPAAVYAQDTSSAIRGSVFDVSGSPVTDATVTVTDQRTGSVRSFTTNSAGSYLASGLRVGGPYTVDVQSSSGNIQKTDLYLSLGDSAVLNLTVGDAATLETVTVLGNRGEALPKTAIGPSAAFSRTDLEDAPSGNRDIKDMIQIDPRIYLDASNSDGIQCGGGSQRFNSLTVDGVQFNDDFGLNSNGYPTERAPFPYAAIDQVSVELAPFDVQYGGFTACNINAVTKSGTNEFHGEVFYDYTDDSLHGDKVKDTSIELGSYDEQRYGVQLAGPIVKDKLFFMLAYEKFDGANIFSRTPGDVPSANMVAGVTEAQYQRIVDIAKQNYDFDAGGLPTSMSNSDEKVLAKFDWYINDKHRLAFTYNYDDGYNVAQSDSSNYYLELSSHYYERGATVNSYVGQLFSNWTDAFSTEMKVGYFKLENRQDSLGGAFGEMRITTTDDSGSSATVLLGSDDSRQANDLSYDTTSFKLSGNYLLGNHSLSAGYELKILDMYDLFIQNAVGTYYFNSIDDFEAGVPASIKYANAQSGVESDGAADWSYDTNTLYAQDEYSFTAIPLRLTGGLRYDWYTSGDKPRENSSFEDIYGFTNATNLDGLDLLQPRLGFDWEASPNIDVHGGVGLYSGGNPNVWTTNAYNNDGQTVITVSSTNTNGDSLFDEAYEGSGRRAGYDAPQFLVDKVLDGDGSQGGINVTDPNFEIPKEWKYNLGAVFYLPQDYRVMADVIYSKKEDSAIITDISREKIGTMGDGRAIYQSKNGRSQDWMLTNVKGDSGDSTVLSLSVDKSWDFGLDAALGYAYVDASEVSPMTSSVAYSNYNYIATSDPQDPGVATSNYEIPNRFTLKMDYKHSFFGNYDTKFTLYGTYNEGRPYSYTFSSAVNSGLGDSSSQGRQLLYVPTGEDDPNVVFGSGFDYASFDAFVKDHGLDKYRGRISPRNAFNSDWWSKLDLRVEQEFPGFRKQDKASAYIVIENFTNLLNKDWGVQEYAAYPQYQSVVAATADATTGTYTFNTYTPPSGMSVETNSSFYEIHIGVRYKF